MSQFIVARKEEEDDEEEEWGNTDNGNGGSLLSRQRAVVNRQWTPFECLMQRASRIKLTNHFPRDAAHRGDQLRRARPTISRQSRAFSAQSLPRRRVMCFGGLPVRFLFLRVRAESYEKRARVETRLRCAISERTDRVKECTWEVNEFAMTTVSVRGKGRIPVEISLRNSIQCLYDVSENSRSIFKWRTLKVQSREIGLKYYINVICFRVCAKFIPQLQNVPLWKLEKNTYTHVYG